MESKSTVLAVFARHPVAANLLMIIIMVVGLGSAFTIQRAMFPAFDLEVDRGGARPLDELGDREWRDLGGTLQPGEVSLDIIRRMSPSVLLG